MRSNGYRVIDCSYFIENYNEDCYRIIELPFDTNKLKGKTKFKMMEYYQDILTRYANGEPFDDIQNIIDNFSELKATSLEKSVSRSKRNIRRICLSNDFEFFSTWTINAKYCNRFYIEDCFQKMQSLTKQMRRVNKNFQYIYVFEKHENGAFHLHGMIKGVRIGDGEYDLHRFEQKDFEKLPYYILDTINKGQDLFYIPFFLNKLGFNTFSVIKNNGKASNYILKYISKDICRLMSGRVYLRSKGLSFGDHYQVANIPMELFGNNKKRKGYWLIDKNGNLLMRVRDIYKNTLTKKELTLFSQIVD